MPDVSRECIRDTLLLKRRFGKAVPRDIRPLYNLGVQNLRRGQLAPHIETMTANRYLNKHNLKRAAPEIIIVVRRGMVEEVRSTNRYTSVVVADYDLAHNAPDQDELLCEAEERGSQPDMHIVY